MTTDKNIGGIFEERTCCICGKKFYAPHGIGNNPDPVYPAIEMENGDLPESRIKYFVKAMKNGEWI